MQSSAPNFGGTMIGIKRIDHINMDVIDLTASVEFYRKNFGFEMKEDKRVNDEQGPWVVIGVSDVAYLCLYEYPDKTISDSDQALRISHFGFAIEDFDTTIEKLQANGIAIMYDGPLDWANSRSIYIKDPSGHVIELAEKIGGGLG
jgi:catechol-2,3-dioxygenase